MKGISRIFFCQTPRSNLRGRLRVQTRSSSLANEDLSAKSTWDRFYARQKGAGPFEWFLESDVVVDVIRRTLTDVIGATTPPSGSSSPLASTTLLDVGCGTSDVFLKLFLHEQRPLSLRCLDFSIPALTAQREAFASVTPAHPGSDVQFLLADVKTLPFETGAVDLILDKGLGDAVLRSRDPDSFSSIVEEFVRVLNAGGRLLQFSDEDPDVRLPAWEMALRRQRLDFRLTFETIDVGQRETFCYKLRLMEKLKESY